ncbi:hypothetical protein HK101_000412 [Irineochytrium annulatum]|nr:hypothetical protein HK101_000412 [Irineochytrium annulatum]
MWIQRSFDPVGAVPPPPVSAGVMADSIASDLGGLSIDDPRGRPESKLLPTPPGGGSDADTRLVSQLLSDEEYARTLQGKEDALDALAMSQQEQAMITAQGRSGDASATSPTSSRPLRPLPVVPSRSDSTGPGPETRSFVECEHSNRAGADDGIAGTAGTARSARYGRFRKDDIEVLHFLSHHLDGFPHHQVRLKW